MKTFFKEIWSGIWRLGITLITAYLCYWFNNIFPIIQNNLIVIILGVIIGAYVVSLIEYKKDENDRNIFLLPLKNQAYKIKIVLYGK